MKDRREVVLAIEAGQRESKESWAWVLRDKEQRCWNHRLTNVIDQLPKKEWPAANALMRKIPYAESRAECEQLQDEFAARLRKPCPKAVETLGRDWEWIVTFYRFPKDHWIHLRTANWLSHRSQLCGFEPTPLGAIRRSPMPRR